MSVIVPARASAAPPLLYSSSRKVASSPEPALSSRLMPLMLSAVKVDCRAAAFSASPMP